MMRTPFPLLSFLAALAIALGAACPAHASGAPAHGEPAHGEKEKLKAPPQRSPTSLRSWVMIDPFTISVIHDDSVKGSIVVNFGLDVPDDGLRDKVKVILPRLRNEWLLTLNRFASTSLRPRRPADVAQMIDRLQRATDAALKAPGAKVLMSLAVVNLPR